MPDYEFSESGFASGRQNRDPATALHYLGEANQITRTQTLNALNTNMKKAAFTPVIEIGRDAVSPTVESLESATKRSHRTL